MSNDLYKLNEKLVVRENDRALFNAMTFKIFKFNTSGFDILIRFRGKGASLDATINGHYSNRLSSEDIKKFLDKCIENQILVKC